jgi:hypothetical protein
MSGSPLPTVTVTDPHHGMYGRVGVILIETEWYTHVRILYHNDVQILSKEQYKNNKVEAAE